MRVPRNARSDDGSLVDRLSALTDAVTRYDLVLLAVPLAFAVGGVAGAAVEATRLGLRAGSAGALAAVAYALFGDPPAGNGPNGRRTA